MMWRFALLCSVVTLTVACTDGPGAPNMNTDGPSLVSEGDPPPPPLDGTGFASFSPSGSDDLVSAADLSVAQDCIPPVFAFGIEGDYFQNKSENNARIHFTPVPGSGSGTIHETANNNTDPLDNRQDASGSITVLATNTGEEHQIHLVDYDGATLFQPQRSFGSIFGDLEAEVMACGERMPYTGSVSFTWFPDDGGKKSF